VATNKDQRRSVPSVTAILQNAAIDELVQQSGRATVTDWIRDAIASLRTDLSHSSDSGSAPHDSAMSRIVADVMHHAHQHQSTRMRRLVNATGVILHTNLGRAPLSDAAVAAIEQISGGGNVEINTTTGVRSYRGHQLQPHWHALTGCEDSLVVNNNAGATLLTLQALCTGREVVISRGQLIEIGGSFRLPEIFEMSGVTLREVGTTNRTRLSDYEDAIGPNTAAIMKVHPSNYRVVGFTSEPQIEGIVEIARRHNILAIDDIGSGSLVDVTRYGFPYEPTFQDSLNAGADLVLGSGDKLLGGPQAGIILGRTDLIVTIRQHPLARCIRVDKLAMAALDATLNAYQLGRAESEIPVLELLSASMDSLWSRAKQVAAAIGAKRNDLRLDVRETTATVGGGSVPGVGISSVAIHCQSKGLTTESIASGLRTGSPGLMTRIQDDQVVIDFRSIRWRDDADVVSAVSNLSAS
jgi:L-seryl-tRNA(Ser) seleniumtransferase